MKLNEISNLQVLHGQWLNFTSGVMILEEFCTIQWSTMEWRLLHKFECYIVPLFPLVMQPGDGWWLEYHHQNLNKSKHSEIVSHFILHWTKLVPRKKKVDYIHCKKQLLMRIFSFLTR